MDFLRRIFGSLREMFSRLNPGGKPLCDTCKYDYPGACSRPERPNALKCPDYKRR